MNISEFINNLNLSVEWLGVREVTTTSTSFLARDGKIESYNSHHDQGWMVEVLVNGQFAAVATNNPNFKALESAALQAKEIAEKASLYKIYSFDTTVRPSHKGVYESPDSSFISLKDFSDLLIQTTHDLKINNSIIIPI